MPAARGKRVVASRVHFVRYPPPRETVASGPARGDDAPDGALVFPDGAWLVLPDGAEPVLPA